MGTTHSPPPRPMWGGWGRFTGSDPFRYEPPEDREGCVASRTLYQLTKYTMSSPLVGSVRGKPASTGTLRIPVLLEPFTGLLAG